MCMYLNLNQRKELSETRLALSDCFSSPFPQVQMTSSFRNQNRPRGRDVTAELSADRMSGMSDNVTCRQEAGHLKASSSVTHLHKPF